MEIDADDLRCDLRAWLDHLPLQSVYELKHLSDEELHKSKLLPLFARRSLPLEYIKEEIEDVWVSWS